MTLALGEASPELSRQVLVECLREFPEVRLTVTGDCMAPAMRAGDIVTLVDVARRRPRLGDVVLAAVADGFRLHRLVWAPARGRWRIKADRAPTWDAALHGEDILATAVDVRTGTETRARGTRSAGSWVRSVFAVAGAHVRALARPRPPI
jgi:hypothetical protein